MSTVLLIDNYDSFTYNLADYFSIIGANVKVRLNDAISMTDIDRLAPDYIVFSPGPGTPNDAGICQAIMQTLSTCYPILGICLGHQVIAQHFGATISQATQIQHGKTSAVHHHGNGLFRQLPTPFNAMRYHSLAIQANTLPPTLETTAWTTTKNDDAIQEDIMAIQHHQLPIAGVQFHPESILSEHGKMILTNFLDSHVNAHL